MENQPTQGEWTVEAKNLIKCNGEQIGSANSMIDEYEVNAKLMAASKDLLEDASDSQIMIWLLCHGGAFVSKTSMYDEDGGEGWKWEYNGREVYEVGNWSDNPPLPEDLKRLVIVSTDTWKSETIKKLTK